MRGLARRASRAGGVTLVLVLAAAPPGAAAQDVRWGDEGPLQNDAFVPFSEAAEAELARGDRAWERAEREGAAARAEAFDAWRSALTVSETGDAVRVAQEGSPAAFADPDGSRGRRTEGVAYAVLRRLALSGEPAREEWSERFEGLAEAARAREPVERRDGGERGAALARLEREFPLTGVAAGAALALGDLAFEAGRPAAAATWFARAERHAEGGSGFGEALAARRAVLERWEGEPAPEAWELASRLRPMNAERLEGRSVPRGALRSASGATPPGLVFLDDGSFVVQSPVALVRFVAVADGIGLSAGRFPLSDLAGTRWNRPFAAVSSGGWPLDPATDGRDVVVVAGRAAPARATPRPFLSGEGPVPSNVLLCVRFDANGFPAARWRLDAEGWRVGGEDEPRRRIEDVLGPGFWEFQPGPVVIDDSVLVLARAQPTREDGRGGGLWLASFDLADGSLRWRRFLTEPADLATEGSGRFGGGTGLTTPSAPLARAGGAVFAPTNAGIGVLVEACDGRVVWTYKNRRRSPDDPGWAGARAPTVAGGAAGERFVLWAPFDSDVLYAVRAAPDTDGRGLVSVQGTFPLTPLAIGAFESVVGGDASELLAIEAAGARRALVSLHADGSRVPSLYLGRDERVAGPGVASDERVLLSTDESLFVFDRARELALLEVLPLADLGAGRGGAVHARGARIVVVGEDTVWTLRAER